MEKIENKKAFADAVWYGKFNEIFPKALRVNIIGAGGTGSWLAFFLSRMECPFAIYDGDIVEERNLSGQFFKIDDISKYKAKCVVDNCREFSIDTASMISIEEYFNSSFDPPLLSFQIVFSCVDNFKAREEIFLKWEQLIKNLFFNKTKGIKKPYLYEECIFIDMRLELELLQVYVVTYDKIKDYKETLKSDEDVPSAPCTLKQTTHNAAMIAGIAVNQFNNFVSNLYTGNEMRTIDLFTEYFTPLNSFNYGK